MTETHAYKVKIIFQNTIKDERDTMKFIAFAKSMQEIEDLAKKECGENYIGIKNIKLMDEIPLF